MKIAFIYDTAYPWVTGGAENRIFEIGKRLRLRGHDIHVFSLGYWMETKEYYGQETIKYNDITYHSVGKPMELYTKDGSRYIKEALYFDQCLEMCIRDRHYLEPYVMVDSFHGMMI